MARYSWWVTVGCSFSTSLASGIWFHQGLLCGDQYRQPPDEPHLHLGGMACPGRHLRLGVGEFLATTVAAVRSAFIGQTERDRLLAEVVLPGFRA